MNGARPLPSLVLGLVLASAFLFPGAAHADELSPPTDPDLQPPATVPEALNARVHIKSKGPVELWRFEKSSGKWTVACTSPCDRDLPVGDEYRVVYGGGAPAGAIFRLRASSSDAVTLTVDGGSKAGEVAGTAIIVLGVGLAALSVVGLVAGVDAANQKCPPDGHDWCGLGSSLGAGLALVSGLGLLASGGIIVGGASVIGGSRESTTQKSTPVSAFVREPTWVAPRAASAGKPAFFVPLSLSF